jgi:hypothetical protein
MKKLSTLLLSGLMLFSFSEMKAAIVYTDVIPDVISSGNYSLSIDLDNNGVPDVDLTGASNPNLSFTVVQATQPQTMNNYILSDGAGNALALNFGSPIAPSSVTWFQMNTTNLQMITVINNMGQGTWNGAMDKYLGVQFYINSNIHFGWIRFSFSSTSNTCTLKDYAYDNTPNTPINAGDMLTGLSSLDFNAGKLNAYPNPAVDIINLDFNPAENVSYLIISDVMGRIVKKIEIPANTEKYILQLEAIQAGVYFANLNGIVRKIQLIK